MDPTKFIKQSEQTVTSKLANVADGSLLSLESNSGVVGTIARIAGTVGLTDSIFGQISNLTSATDSFVSNQFNALFGDSSLSIAGAISANTGITDGPILKFPLDIGSISFKMQFMRYSRPTPLVNPTITPTQTIIFPLPQQLIEGHTMKYDTEALGTVGSIADALGQGTSQSAIGAGTQAGVGLGRAAVSAVKRSAERGAGTLSKLTALTAGASLGKEVTAATSQLAGVTINPNLSVSYSGPGELRRFDYSWEFHPHNSQESTVIENIINQLKIRSLPSLTEAGSTALLSYPQMVQLTLSPDITKYKKMMISAIAIDKTAAGIPSFFKGTKLPTFYRITISFQEIEYFTSEDFGGATGTGFNADPEKLAEQAISATTQGAKDAASSVGSFLSNILNPQGG